MSEEVEEGGRREREGRSSTMMLLMESARYLGVDDLKSTGRKVGLFSSAHEGHQGSAEKHLYHTHSTIHWKTGGERKEMSGGGRGGEEW